ncbi:triacylglycerol lipase [Agrococcus sp. UYP10]|uniref:esterase/lipase family protein n=1 Tax=Agrococcus sp. UYP10 TaxID=1756355 RepID=UPI00339292B0
MTAQRPRPSARLMPGEALVWAGDYRFAAMQHVRSWFDRRPPSLTGPADARVHVVLVPGVVERWHFMEPLAKHLVHAGHAVRFVPELDRNLAPVLESAPIVRDVVDRVAAEHPHARIVLVGHSKGGLIGKRVLVDRALEPDMPQPDGLVALATPFAGSARARFIPGTWVRELDASSEVLLALAAERVADARIRVVLPRIDPHIPGNEIPEGMQGVRLRASGHFRPLATREAAEAVLDAIRALTSDERPAPGAELREAVRDAADDAEQGGTADR